MSRYGQAFGRELPSGLTVANPNSLMAPKFSIRLSLRDEGLDELAETLRKDHAGIIHPLIARKTKTGLERVVGGRRQRAAKMAGLTSVPVIVREMDDATAFEAQLIENLHHLALTDYELGRAFAYMLESWSDRYPNQEAIAKRIGKDKSQQWVSLHLQAFQTAEELKRDHSTTRVVKQTDIENMTERQLRALRQIPPEQRADTITKLISEKPEIHEAEPFRPPVPSGRDLEREAKALREPASEKHTEAQLTCPECHLTFALIHKERRGDKVEHRVEQVIIV
jgi:ParB/RepB/Spo0J family partition protein